MLPPTINPVEVDTFRGMLAGATSADECRLLVDMFFARHGFPFTDASRVAVDAGTVLPAGGAYTEIPEAGGDIEGSLIELFLGGNHASDEETTSSPATVVASEEPAPVYSKDAETRVLSEAKAAPDAVHVNPIVETTAPLVMAA